MAQSDNQADLRLIALVGQRDRDAFRELYGKYQTRLTRFLFNVVRQPQIVEEVLDDTMMVVWERASSFKGESKLSTWMFAIAYRKAVKALRRYDEPVEDHDRDGRISTAAGPEEEYELSRLRRLLKTAMAELSPDHRAVVDLTYFHELGYREIAEILNCPVDTVKTRMFYARRHLRRCLEGELPDWI
ncbi:MAG TPA: sigma-70 family RNA polymerase sigma factor [Croceibacterium sp.]|nr:sigma-70 family RNA polymerase sigma factor [Croceibacterium sp.]